MARFGKLGWFLGLIFGTLFGVLFAPRTGKELRGKIKSERRKGNLGIAPIKDEMTHLGQQLAEMAKELYQSKRVQEVVTQGRKKMKELSDEFVGDVADFHVSRIKPLRRAYRSLKRFQKKKHGK